MEGIEISQGKVGARRDVAMLAVKGYVDTMTCSILLSKITENLNAGILHVVVDMAHVNYVSSAGWGVFVGEIKGIRERGGDLKIVQMTPEVYDVFEMLEFHRILNYYESLEEAINDFDIAIGLDITKSTHRAFHATAQADPQSPAASEMQLPVERERPMPSAVDAKDFAARKRKIEPHLLPLTEKLKHAVVEDPTCGAFKIKKILKTPKFGNTKVNILKLYKLMRKLNLDTKEKRYRFYRSR